MVLITGWSCYQGGRQPGFHCTGNFKLVSKRFPKISFVSLLSTNLRRKSTNQSLTQSEDFFAARRLWVRDNSAGPIWRETI